MQRQEWLKARGAQAAKLEQSKKRGNGENE